MFKFLIILPFLFVSCKKSQIEKIEKHKTLEEIHATHLKGVKEIWKLNADSIDSITSDCLEIHDFELTIYEKQKINIRSQKVEINLKTMDFKTIGKTKILTNKGEEIITADVNYSNEKKQIYSTRNVVIMNGEKTINGEGFVSDLWFSSITVMKPLIR